MALMNLNLDGVLTVEKVVVPADGITVLSHSLFRGEKIVVRYNGDELTRGQDFIPDRIDDRLYFQKNVCLFTALKILNESLFGQEIEVEYFACGDYINAEIWNEYPSSASLKQSLASKVDNSDFIEQIKRIDGDINKESTVRADADNTLQDNINIEANLRIAEDEKLQTNINNEAAARADADNTLQDNINAEEANRQSADAENRADLENETNLRLAGDSNLQTQISDLKTKFESFVPGLTYKVVSVLPTADILIDVIYLVPADSTGSQSVYDEYIYIDGNWELIGTTATTQAITVDSALSETSTNPVQNKVITAELKSRGKVYTSLSQLGLTAPVTVGEIFNAMPNKTMAVIACEGKEGNTDGAVVHVSDVPVSYGVLTIKKNEKGRFSIEYQNSLQGSPCNVKRWIGTLKGNDGTGLYWKQLSAEPTFVTLNDIGLTANATIQDVVDALPKGGSALLGVKEFTNYQTMFPYEDGNDQFARVHIVKGVEDGSYVYARWFRKDGVKEAIAKFNINDNKFNGWQQITAKSITELTVLGLDGSATIQNVMDKMSIGQHCIINTSRFGDKTEVDNIEYGKVEIRRLSSEMWSLWLEDVLHGNVVAHGTCSASKFAGWQYLASKDYVDNAVSNSGNTFNGKEVKSITIDLSASAFQVKGTSLYKIALDNYISANTNVIKVEGYYVPPTDANSTYKDKRYIVHTSDSDRAGGIRYYDGSWTTCVCQSESGSKKGSGYAKIYYIN